MAVPVKKKRVPVLRLKTDEELVRDEELDVRLSAKGDYAWGTEACAIVHKILLALGYVGLFTLHMESIVRSRSTERFKLKTGTQQGIRVVVKPAGQDSAGRFRLVCPAAVHPLEAYNAIATYVKSANDVGVGDDEEEEEVPPANPPPEPPAAALPAAGAATVAAFAGDSDILGSLVQLQQCVTDLRFHRSARETYERTCQELLERRDLLQLELDELSAELTKAQADLAEVPVVSDEELAAAEARWAKVEEGLKLLRGALT